jgi:integral membrane protein (TIGR01906 family)
MTIPSPTGEAPQPARAWSWRLLGVLAPVAVVLVLVTTSVRWATNSLPLYDRLFERHGVAERTGITPQGLRSVGAQIQEYFATDVEPLQVEAEVYGLLRPLFSRREALHMADVKSLFRVTWRVQGASALFLLMVAGATAARLRGHAWPIVAKWARNGAILTGTAVVVIGAASAVAFGPLFTLFHRLGFRNDLWVLDPRTDYLIQLFPFGFWRDVTLIIGVAALVEAALLLVVAHLLLRRLSSRSAARHTAEAAP